MSYVQMGDINDDNVLRDAVRDILEGANFREMTLRKLMNELAARFHTTVDAINHRKKVVRNYTREFIDQHQAAAAAAAAAPEDMGHANFSASANSMDHLNNNNNNLYPHHQNLDLAQVQNQQHLFYAPQTSLSNNNNNSNNPYLQNHPNQQQVHPYSQYAQSNALMQHHQQQALANHAAQNSNILPSINNQIPHPAAVYGHGGDQEHPFGNLSSLPYPHQQQHHHHQQQHHHPIGLPADAAHPVLGHPASSSFIDTALDMPDAAAGDQLASNHPYAHHTASMQQHHSNLPEATEHSIQGSDDEPTPQKKRKRPSAERKPRKQGPVRLGFNKALVLSQPLANLLGARILSRPRAQQQIIAYVKQQNLQDPSDRRSIVADDNLRYIFNVDRFTFFSLSKLLADHLTSPEEHGADIQQEAAAYNEKALEELRAKQAEENLDAENNDDVGSSVKEAKPSKSSSKKQRNAAKESAPKQPRLTGLTKAVVLRPPLALLTGARVMSRHAIRQWIITYVKTHNLQDPADRRFIFSDDKLVSIFNVQRFSYFDLSRLITNLVISPTECDASLQAEAEACDAQFLSAAAAELNLVE